MCGLSLYYQTLSFFEVSIELTGNTVLYLLVISYIMSNTNSKYSDVNIYITIKVKDGTGDDTMFTIKKITKMKKVFDVYAQVKGIEEGSLCFMLDGERVGDNDTPELLGLEDDDQIDCFYDMPGSWGGGLFVEPSFN